MAARRPRARCAARVPAEPGLAAAGARHRGRSTLDASPAGRLEADAAFTRKRGAVCAVVRGRLHAGAARPTRPAAAVAAAHAGWRGLSAGVIEATLLAHAASARQACSPGSARRSGRRAYEVGDGGARGVRRARRAAAASPRRRGPGHWLLDLYAVARQRLRARRRGRGLRRRLLHLLRPGALLLLPPRQDERAHGGAHLAR